MDYEHYQQALACLQAQGHQIHELMIDGNIHRTRINGHKRGSKNGYYAFWNTPFLTGYYGDFKSGAYDTYSAKNKASLSDSERQAYYEHIQTAKRQRKQAKQAEYEATRQRALTIWAGLYPASSQHPYVQRKRMGVEGLRQGKKQSLVVPLYNQEQLASLQFIDKNGGKKFLSGGKLKGSYFPWGQLIPKPDTAYIAEGVSTGWAVHVLSEQRPVICAMNANNLENVALYFREKWQQTQLIIAADNDVKPNSGENVGVKYAKQAAIACQGKIIIPERLDQSGGACDWNDLYVMTWGACA